MILLDEIGNSLRNSYYLVIAIINSLRKHASYFGYQEEKIIHFEIKIQKNRCQVFFFPYNVK